MRELRIVHEAMSMGKMSLSTCLTRSEILLKCILRLVDSALTPCIMYVVKASAAWRTPLGGRLMLMPVYGTLSLYSVPFLHYWHQFIITTMSDQASTRVVN